MDAGDSSKPRPYAEDGINYEDQDISPKPQGGTPSANKAYLNLRSVQSRLNKWLSADDEVTMEHVGGRIKAEIEALLSAHEDDLPKEKGKGEPIDTSGLYAMGGFVLLAILVNVLAN